MNPYERPTAEVADAAAVGHAADLAGLGERLGAALLDGVIQLIVVVPLMFLGGYWETVMQAAMRGERPGFGYTLVWAAVGFALFVAVQGVPLARHGQTWGKRAMKIRIADLQGSKPRFSHLLVLRYLPQQALGLIPILGPLLTLVDVLFVFGRDRRCVHDRIAGTRVVRAG